MKYELIIFDWDGTVVNSIQQIVQCIHVAGEQVGLPQLTDLEAQSIIGLGIHESILTLHPQATDTQIHGMIDAYKSAWLSSFANDIQFYPTVESTLRELSSQHKLAVATGKSRAGLDRHFGLSSISEVFHTSRCADETTSKPDPHMLHEILDELDVPAHKALMVGDTTYDLEMAQRAGMDSVGMSYGAHSIEALEACDPKTILHTMSDIHHWLK